MVREFIDTYRLGERDELAFFKELSPEQALEFAALAKDSRGKRFSHQRRLTRESLQQGKQAIMSMLGAFQKATSFDEVLKGVRDVTSKVHGLGELYAYDTALRISANKGHEPTLVYLHAGTRVGAKRLGIPTNRDYVPMTELPEALMPLKAHEVESFLCIYKNHFGGVVERRA
ncbi:hypothetical protein GTZ97_03820 [Aquabacterium fontiphilum]|uniref:hypothetical protein n=1 Tax=Aquabacterium fontiphilum TaxID=450365 RepID=UPI0013788049|nr:hypothetical protein [Aquabacterium fontiphilum]NBD19799.1 hypothetical protein [Aquabacterium fontiphilum]